MFKKPVPIHNGINSILANSTTNDESTSRNGTQFRPNRNAAGDSSNKHRQRELIMKALRARHGLLPDPNTDDQETENGVNNPMQRRKKPKNKLPLEQRFPPAGRPMFGFVPNPIDEMEHGLSSPTPSWPSTVTQQRHESSINASLFSLNTGSHPSQFSAGPRDLPTAPVQHFRWSVSSNNSDSEPDSEPQKRGNEVVNNNAPGNQTKNNDKKARPAYTQRDPGGTFTDSEGEELIEEVTEPNTQSSSNNHPPSKQPPAFDYGTVSRNPMMAYEMHESQVARNPEFRHSLVQSSSSNVAPYRRASISTENSSVGGASSIPASSVTGGGSSMATNPLVQYVDPDGTLFFAASDRPGSPPIDSDCWTSDSGDFRVDTPTPIPPSSSLHSSTVRPSVLSSSSNRTFTAPGDAFELFNELDLLYSLGQSLHLDCNIRQQEGSFIFAHPSSGRLIVLTRCETLGGHGIRISQHKNGHLFCEAHVPASMDRWLMKGLLRGICEEFFLSN